MKSVNVCGDRLTMFNFLTKKTIEIRDEQVEELEAVETWMVRWDSWSDSYAGRASAKEQCEVFLDEGDANKFALALKTAFELTKSDGANNIKVEKNV